MAPSAIEPQAIADTQSAIFVDRLSVDGVEARRSRAPKLNGGIAAYTSSQMFKGPVRNGVVLSHGLVWCYLVSHALPPIHPI